MPGPGPWTPSCGRTAPSPAARRFEANRPCRAHRTSASNYRNIPAGRRRARRQLRAHAADCWPTSGALFTARSLLNFAGARVRHRHRPQRVPRTCRGRPSTNADARIMRAAGVNATVSSIINGWYGAHDKNSSAALDRASCSRALDDEARPVGLRRRLHQRPARDEHFPHSVGVAVSALHAAAGAPAALRDPGRARRRFTELARAILNGQAR